MFLAPRVKLAGRDGSKTYQVARLQKTWRMLGRAKHRPGVRPINCHPPGVWIGYTPVCWPAIPTEPAGTCGRGVARRGVKMRCDSPPRYGKPGAKPIM